VDEGVDTRGGSLKPQIWAKSLLTAPLKAVGGCCPWSGPALTKSKIIASRRIVARITPHVPLALGLALQSSRRHCDRLTLAANLVAAKGNRQYDRRILTSYGQTPLRFHRHGSCRIKPVRNNGSLEERPNGMGSGLYGLRNPPKRSKRDFISGKLVPVASAGSGHLVRSGTLGSIGVLPHRPRAPIRGDHRCRSILREPKPAICKN